MRRLPGLLALLFLAACHREAPPAQTAPAVVATSETVEFGTVPVLQSKQRWLELRNTTNTAVHVTSLDVLDHIAFSVEAEQVEIPANKSLRLPVHFHPQAPGEQHTTLTVLTDSPVTPSLTVTVSGTGQGSGVSVRTPVLDFQSVLTGEQKTLQLILVNDSNVAKEVTIPDPSSVSAFFTSGGVPTGTRRLEPQEALQLPITFVAYDVANVSAKLPIIRCEGCTPFDVSLVAQGVDSYFSTKPVDELLFDSNAPSPKLGQRALPLVMSNAGDAPLTVTSMEIVSGGEWASLQADLPAVIPPHGQLSVPVTVLVDKVARAGLLKITTTDKRRPEVQIKLTVPEMPPGSCLVVAPSMVDFGTPANACSSMSRQVVIYNSCLWPIQMTKIGFAQNPFPFGITTSPTFPVTITPAKPARFDVRFVYGAVQPGSYEAEVRIETSDLDQPTITVPLRGISPHGRREVDTWQQPPQQQSDVLLVIDDSPAMASYQQSLERNLVSFKQYLDNQDVNTNLAVTTMDVSSTGERGRFVPLDGSRLKVVNDQTFNGATIFHDNANVGFAGSTTQHGLEAMSLAFDASLLAGDNAGFLRPDAFLSVILISASPEASVGVVDDYLGPLWALKGPHSANMVTVSTVSVPTATGDRYAEAAKKTGGIATSIDLWDWEQDFRKISLLAFGQKSRFYLTSLPEAPASIEVKVDGQVLPASTGYWSYTSTSNSVDFLPLFIPPPGSTIEISYDVGCGLP